MRRHVHIARSLLIWGNAPRHAANGSAVQRVAFCGQHTDPVRGLLPLSRAREQEYSEYSVGHVSGQGESGEPLKLEGSSSRKPIQRSLGRLPPRRSPKGMRD